MPRKQYAAETEVPVSRSRAAIEELLREHGATKFASGWSETHDTLQFELHGRVIRFMLPRPDRNDSKFTQWSKQQAWRKATAQMVQSRIEQADRQRWRALYLVIRAKIEAVEAGIAIFEQEFLAFIVLPNDLTIGDALVPQLQAGAQLRLGDGQQ